MYNQVMFQIWSWYHKNCGFCEILFGRSTKNNLWVTPKLTWIFLKQFSFTNQSFSVTISLLLQNSCQIGNLDCQTFQTICVLCQDYKQIYFLKHKPQNHRVYIYKYMCVCVCVCVFISWFIPLKGQSFPMIYKHFETDYQKMQAFN